MKVTCDHSPGEFAEDGFYKCIFCNERYKPTEQGTNYSVSFNDKIKKFEKTYYDKN